MTGLADLDEDELHARLAARDRDLDAIKAALDRGEADTAQLHWLRDIGEDQHAVREELERRDRAYLDEATTPEVRRAAMACRLCLIENTTVLADTAATWDDLPYAEAAAWAAVVREARRQH